MLGKDGQHDGCDEEDSRQDGRGAGQHVRRTPTAHEPTTAADAERAPFGALQEHHCHEGKHDHEVNDDDDGLHLVSNT